MKPQDKNIMSASTTQGGHKNANATSQAFTMTQICVYVMPFSSELMKVRYVLK